MMKLLSGSEIRAALSDLERIAHIEGRRVSSECIQRFMKTDLSTNMNADFSNLQIDLPLIISPTSGGETSGFGVTFRDSKRLPVHGWYPYVEGFSAKYVYESLSRFGGLPQTVYDPFGGSGTTQLASSALGVHSYYSELNPFMRFVAETKVESSIWAQSNRERAQKAFKEFVDALSSPSFSTQASKVSLDAYEAAFPGRNFFEVAHIKQLLHARNIAENIADPSTHLRQLLLLACAANLVECSNMTRRADLRRRRPDEYKGRTVNVPNAITMSAQRMISDISSMSSQMAPMKFISEDARSLPDSCSEVFDVVITSPPYLNGTNYFRNTKMELWFLDFIKSEKELSGFRSQTVCGGINDVSNEREAPDSLNSVQKIVCALEATTKDARIPRMVAYYFDDMRKVFDGVHRGLKKGGRFLLDIGDSCFYGVHVPTDNLLAEVGKSCGFEVESQAVLAKRYSKSSMKLTQSEIVFRKKENQ